MDETHAIWSKNSPWLTLDEAAAYCKVSRSFIYEKIRELGIKVEGALRRPCIHVDELDRLMRRRFLPIDDIKESKKDPEKRQNSRRNNGGYKVTYLKKN
jgi:excisionase family DNA binding protein